MMGYDNRYSLEGVARRHATFSPGDCLGDFPVGLAPDAVGASQQRI